MPIWIIIAGLDIPTSVAVIRDWLTCTVQLEKALQPLRVPTICQVRTRFLLPLMFVMGFLRLAVIFHTMCTDSVLTSKTWIWEPVPSSVPTCLFFDENQTHKYSGTFSPTVSPKVRQYSRNLSECWLLAHSGSAVLACALSAMGLGVRAAHRRAQESVFFSSVTALTSILDVPVAEVLVQSMWVKWQDSSCSLQEKRHSLHCCELSGPVVHVNTEGRLGHRMGSKLPPNCSVTSAIVSLDLC